LRDVPERYRPQVEEYFRSLDRQQAGQPAPNPPPLPNPRPDVRAFANYNVAGLGNNADGQNPAANPRGGVADVIQEVADLVEAAPNRPAAPPAAVNPDGNRLTVNRVEDRSGLVSEARDPARQNAVIHKSIIKLSGGLTPKNAPGGVMRSW
jgi:hypothetical protein